MRKEARVGGSKVSVSTSALHWLFISIEPSNTTPSLTLAPNVDIFEKLKNRFLTLFYSIPFLFLFQIKKLISHPWHQMNTSIKIFLFCRYWRVDDPTHIYRWRSLPLTALPSRSLQLRKKKTQAAWTSVLLLIFWCPLPSRE